MSLYEVVLLQCLFVSPVLCVYVNPFVVYPHLFVSLPVCVSSSAVLCERALVSLCCSE